MSKSPAGVKARHLRRLSADQCASGLRAPLGDALHDGGHDILVELAGCKIIQEKQWLGSLNDNVVDAHGHQVDADRVVHAALNGDLQLCADAVVGGDQDRIDKPRRSEIEQSAESAKLRARPRSARAASEWAYSIHDPVANIDVDPRLGVSQRLSAFGHPDSQGFRHDRGNCTLGNTQARRSVSQRGRLRVIRTPGHPWRRPREGMTGR